MVDGDARIKLVDFGISRVASFAELTRTGATVGSPEYMAPELFVASAFDPRADLYAVGVLAFEMLAGRAPYRADSVALLYHAHAHDPIPQASAHRAEIPAWVDAFVSRLLAKNPFDRYQTAEEALADLGEQRVLAAELPALSRRECLACGEQTLEELFVCAFCGYHDLETFIPGAFDVCVSPEADPEKLTAFLEKLGRKPDPTRTHVLARGVDKTSAELLRESARRHGVYVSVETRSFLARLSPAAFTLAALGVATPFAVMLFPWLLVPSSLSSTFHTTASVVRDVVAFVSMVAVGVGASLVYYRRQHEPALLGSTSAPLAREYGWLSELVPLLARLPDSSLRGQAARLVEKHYFLHKLSPHLPAELAEPIEEILRNAVELSIVLSDVDALFDDVRSSGAERSLDDDQRAALMALSDRQASLARHLARAAGLFNRLAGEAVASTSGHIDVTPATLHEAQHALELEIEASREVRRELEAIS